MTNKRCVAAALCAWLSMTATVAQTTPANPTTQARLAASVLAESRGDFTVALRELEAALTTAGPDEQAQIRAAMTALRQRLGQEPDRAQRNPAASSSAGSGSAPNQGQAPHEDPVQRLIGVIDRGSIRDSDVHAAYRQLEDLGSLAIPPLLETMPRLGPFGLHNALQLLVMQDDARVRSVLLELVARKDSAEVATLAQLLDEMSSTNKLLVAAQLVTTEHSPAVRMSAFRVLARDGSDQDTLTELARELLGTTSLHSDLLGEARGSRRTWARLILAELAEHGEGSVRSFANELVLTSSKDLAEERALAALATMDSHCRTRTALALIEERPTWVRVGVIALQSDARQVSQPWFERMQWWRRPDEAIAALLALPAEALGSTELRRVIEEIVRSGWRMPSELEPAFARFAQRGRWVTFVMALPDDGEARAIAVWERSGPSDRDNLVQAAAYLERPWHDLIVRHLAATKSCRDLEPRLLQRDWSGMSAKTTREFSALIAGWQAQGEAVATLRPTPSTNTTPVLDWRQALYGAARKWPLTPIEILLPMVRAEEPEAWRILTDLDPLAGLVEAERWQDSSAIASWVVDTAARHGDRRHLELVIRALRSPANNQGWGSIGGYLQTHGAGEPAVIALAKQPPPVAGRDDRRSEQAAATKAARSAHVRDLDELLQMLPELSEECATTLLDALDEQLRQEHGPSLSRALSASLEAALSPERSATALQLGRFWPVRLASLLLDHLTRLGVEQAIPLAQRILAQPDANNELVRSAVLACITLARDNRTRLLGELLDDARPTVLAWALTAKDLRDDPGLREKAIAAILRHGSEIESLDMLFDNLRPEDQLAFATQLLAHERFPQFSRGVAISILTAVGNRKNGDLADKLGRGASHPDAYVRQQTAWQLGRTFDRQAAPFLLGLLKDDDRKVRERANQSLEQLARFFEAQEQWRDRLK